METDLAKNLEEVRERIARAAAAAGRDPSEVTLVGVTKAHTADLAAAAAGLGLEDLGENYVQEAQRKIDSVGRNVRWHLIGPLQTNKAKFAVGLFHLIHTLDRVKLARELDKRAHNAGVRQKVLIQVNLTGREERAGVLPEDLRELMEAASTLDGIEVRGLMTVPPFLSPEEVRPYFARLREIRREAESWGVERVGLEELSMGMSQDFEVAIQEGATIVRVGTLIFGARD